jgi:hydrogenase maturation factor
MDELSRLKAQVEDLRDELLAEVKKVKATLDALRRATENGIWAAVCEAGPIERAREVIADFKEEADV